jgi:uncharacterized protein (TIGR01777 family)
MKIVIAGGSGQVGAILVRALANEQNEVVLLSRQRRSLPSVRCVCWDANTVGPWAAELDGADVVINLAGRSVNCRYGMENRREILESRVHTVRAMGRAIAQASRPPRVWLQAGTATIYAHRFDQPNDEFSGIIGGDETEAPDTWRFSIDVAKAWEAAMDEFATLPATRRVIMRSAMIMSPDPGGIFATLLRLVRFGLGGRAGHGRQYVSWIHENDFANVVRRLIADETFAGRINVCSPQPLPNEEFMRELRRAWGTSFGLNASDWMLAIGAFFIRTETELILKSRRVVPGILQQRGFHFLFPTWSSAARDLCSRYRAGKSKPPLAVSPSSGGG